MNEIKKGQEIGQLTVDSLEPLEDAFSFKLLMEQLAAGATIMVETENNSLYNNKKLRASQKGIRKKAAEEAVLGIGQPEQPVAKLTRCISRKGKTEVLLIVLNGHHRTGVRIINSMGISLEILMAEDLIEGTFSIKPGLDFDDSLILDQYGLKTDPREIKHGYGFNTIVSKLRDFRATGEITLETQPDPINKIR